MMSTTTGHAAVRLERTIPAPPHDVYRAWLDPDLLRRWLATILVGHDAETWDVGVTIPLATVHEIASLAQRHV